MLTILSVQVSGSGPRCSLQLAQYEDIYDNHGGCSARPGVVAGKGGIECRTKCFTLYCTISDDLCRLVLAHTGLYLEYLLVQLDREAVYFGVGNLLAENKCVYRIKTAPL